MGENVSLILIGSCQMSKSLDSVNAIERELSILDNSTFDPTRVVKTEIALKGQDRGKLLFVLENIFTEEVCDDASVTYP
jgi:hypothetical protein